MSQSYDAYTSGTTLLDMINKYKPGYKRKQS